MGGTGATKFNPRLRGRVIVLTTFDLGKYAFGGLSAGASVFLFKSTTPEIPTQAMRTVAGGESVVELLITRQLVEHCVRITAEVGAQRDRANPPSNFSAGGNAMSSRASLRDYPILRSTSAFT